LTRARVVDEALALVDEAGLDALSMRAVAARLGVEAMSLYRHVADRDDLVAALADRVLLEIGVPPPGTPWRDALRGRARSTRSVFLRHPSAKLVVEACATMTPVRLAGSDAVVGLLLADGFDPTLAYRALLLLDSYVYGFAMQELGWPHPPSPDTPPPAPDVPVERYPHFAAAMGAVMSKVGAAGLVASYTHEFEFGLDLLLDGLARHRR
jgi:AcrR family transcriptional regulator